MTRRAATLAAVLLLTSAAALLGRDAYLGAKGALAERLVERALAARLAGDDRSRPWAWADFAPLARLSAPRLGIARPVLTGASGESLAFGLGHVDGTAPPGAAGNTVLAGHRDSWGAFLGALRPGDRLLLETPTKKIFYQIVSTSVVDERDAGVLAATSESRLTLITCYPIEGCLPTSRRYVVTCIRA